MNVMRKRFDPLSRVRSLRRRGSDDDLMSRVVAVQSPCTYRHLSCYSADSCPRPSRRRIATLRRSVILTARMHRSCTLIRPIDRILAVSLSRRLDPRQSCGVCVRLLFRE